jgi:hypothetical protein
MPTLEKCKFRARAENGTRHITLNNNFLIPYKKYHVSCKKKVATQITFAKVINCGQIK